MKKKVLCVFVLLFYLLITCTLLSVKIEREMAVETESYLRERGRYNTAGISLPPRALFQDEQGEHLYEIVEGIGWEHGLRIQEIPGNLWDIDVHGMVILQGSRDYNVVYAASRQPEEGDLVVIIEEWKEAEDQYLVLYPESVPAEELQMPENIEIAGQSSNALLLSVKNTTLPFFEHKAKAMSNAMSVQSCRVFSLTEAIQFLEELPSVMVIVSALVMSLCLWGFSCYLSIHANRNKGFIFLNAALMVALLCFQQYILNGVDFPASMLPAENIFDWRHYRDAYTMIFNAMEEFPEEAKSLVAAKELMVRRCKDILSWGLLASMGIVLFERRFGR